MWSGLRDYARQHHVALIALFFALGGSAYAAGLIDGGDVKNSSLTGRDVKNKSLTKVDFSGSVAGPQGPRGITGPQGATGPLGPTGPATGPAGGDLAGSYPNPSIAGGAVGADERGQSPAVRVRDGPSVSDGAGCEVSTESNEVANATEMPICYFDETYDTNNMHATGSDDVEVTKLYAPRPGLYSVTAGMIWTDESAAGSRQLIIKQNGVRYVAAEQIAAAPSGNNTIQNVHGVVRLDAGDYVQAMAWQNSGIALNLYLFDDERSFFAMEWLGP